MRIPIRVSPGTDTPSPGRYWWAEEERLLPEMSAAIPLRSNAVLDLVVMVCDVT